MAMSAPDQRPFMLPGTAGPGMDDSAERATKPNPVGVENRVSDPAWGIQKPAGGPNMPEDPAVTTDPC